jgi:hypothetical protein
MKDWAMSEAANVKPETIEDVGDYTKTMGLKGADEQARMLQEQDAAFGADGARSTAAALNANSADTTPAKDVVTTRYRMADKTQDTPFTQEQINAQRYRNQADVAMRSGDAKEAAMLQGLARQEDEYGIDTKVKANTQAALSKDYADLRGKERQFRAFALAADGYLNEGNLGKWKEMRDASEGIRTELLNSALNRAEMIQDPFARLTALGYAYKYVLDGNNVVSVGKNKDGTFNVKFSNGVEWNTVTENDLPRISALLRNPDALHKMENEAAAKRAQFLFEEGNKAHIVKDGDGNERITTLNEQKLNPGAGSPARISKADQKDADEIFKASVDIWGDRVVDPVTNKVSMVENAKSRQNADIARSIKLANPKLSNQEALRIVEHGRPSRLDGVLEGPNKQKVTVPMYVLDGQFYPMAPTTGAAMPYPDSAPDNVMKNFRDLQSDPISFLNASSRIKAERAAANAAPGLAPVTPSSRPSQNPTPADFPRVSAQEQQKRDQEARYILLNEIKNARTPEELTSLQREWKARIRTEPPTQDQAIAILKQPA